MTRMFGRQLNSFALMTATVVVIVVNSAGASLDWWPGSMWAIAPMLAIAYAAAWLFGKPIAKSAK
jgi:hypothetical protein